eukprot:4690390-Amphidinium_carterae.1
MAAVRFSGPRRVYLWDIAAGQKLRSKGMAKTALDSCSLGGSLGTPRISGWRVIVMWPSAGGWHGTTK